MYHGARSSLFLWNIEIDDNEGNKNSKRYLEIMENSLIQFEEEVFKEKHF